MKTTLLSLLIAAALFPAVSPAQVPGMTVDQSVTASGYVYSGYSAGWQSFTAGTTGFLGAVDLILYSTDGADWTATLSIYEGEGSGGAKLASQTISGNGVVQWNTYRMEVPVRQTQGSQYTIHFGNVSTPLSVRVGADSYAGGRCSQHGGYDYRFQTHVISSDWSEEAYRDTSFTTADTVISTPAQLAQFAHLVNNGARFSGLTVTLANDISLAGHFWTPISTGGAFDGTFDGTGKTIRCVIIDRPTTDTQGLFGYPGGTIRNLNVADVDITGRDDVGGLVGDAIGVVSNCSVSGRVTGRFYVGGVLGYGHGTTTDQCVNRSNVTGSSRVGGVVGGGGLNPVTGCRNEGSVSGSTEYLGGVMGAARSDILDSSNSGAVFGPTVSGCGGIVGTTEHRVRNCRNSGDVSGGVNVGGILGVGCQELMRCVNTGTVNGYGSVGGVAGILTQGTMMDCANQGQITGTSAVGGLAGSSVALVLNSSNTGAVIGGDGVGGLAAAIPPGGEFRNCQNSGAVSGSSMVGALAAAGGVLKNCYWRQTGTLGFDHEAAGHESTILTDCRSFGDGPGTLASAVTVSSTLALPVTTTNLSAALNAYVVANAELHGGMLRRWTAGSAATCPAHADSRWSDPGNYDTAWFNPAATQLYIGTAQELAGLAVLVNGGERFTGKTITLMADITLTEREWTPIGHTFFSAEAKSFYGTLEGNGKTITGAWQDAYDLYRDEYMYRYDLGGLFGVLDTSATVRNLAVVDSQAVGAGGAGGIAGYQQGTLQNCSSSGIAFSREFSGVLAGLNGENATIENCYANGCAVGDGAVGALVAINGGVISNCYWRFTGTDPLDQWATSDGNDIAGCSSFDFGPGLLAAPITVGGTTVMFLPDALNAWVDTHGGGSSGLYNWTTGTWTMTGLTTRLPRLTPVIKVGGTSIPQTLTEGFAVGVSLAATTNTVATYTSAHPGTTAASLGDVLGMADAMGFTFADLVVGSALLDFTPGLKVIGFDRKTWTLTFTAANGIDATATTAMNRLAGSTARLLIVQQMDEPGGATTSLPATFQFHGDGTANASFEFPNPPPRSFFRLALQRQPE
jgi:hypothetical protein